MVAVMSLVAVFNAAARLIAAAQATAQAWCDMQTLCEVNDPKHFNLSQKEPQYVSRFSTNARPVRAAEALAAFARGELRRFKFESPEMQEEIKSVIASNEVDDDYQNILRGAILGISRFQILRHLPSNTKWYRLKVHPLMLATFRTPIAWNEQGRQCLTVGQGFLDLQSRNASWSSEDLERYSGIYRNLHQVERIVIAGGTHFDDRSMFLVDGNHRSLAFYSSARFDHTPVTLYVGISKDFSRSWLGNTYVECALKKLPEWAVCTYQANRCTTHPSPLLVHNSLKALDRQQIFALAHTGHKIHANARDTRNMTALGIAIVSLSPPVIDATLRMGASPANLPLHVPIMPGIYMNPLLVPSLTHVLLASELHIGWAAKLLLSDTPVPFVMESTVRILNTSFPAEEHPGYTGTVKIGALKIALQPQLVSIFDLLIKHGANPSSLDSAGTSVFIHTAKLGLSQVARLLLQSGAKCNETDAHGFDAWDHATLQGHSEFTRFLEESHFCSNIHLGNHHSLTGIVPEQESIYFALEVGAGDVNLKEFFFKHFVLEQRPIIVRGLAHAKWLGKWNAGYMRGTFGNLLMSIADIPYRKYYAKGEAAKSPPISFKDYMLGIQDLSEECEGRENTNPNYWFGKVDTDSATGRIFMQDVETPSLLLDDSRFQYQADYYQFFAGGLNTGSPQHSHGAAWNALIRGEEKKWYFWPPGRSSIPNLHPQSRQHDYDASMQAVQRVGDIVLVPPQWGHATIWGSSESKGCHGYLEKSRRRNFLGYGVAVEFFMTLK